MSGYTDQKMDEQMGLLLRSGVAMACAVMLIGGVLYMIRHGEELPAYRTFHGVMDGLGSVRGILREVRVGSARGVIQLSVLLMIATPVMRVAFAVYGFSRQRNWMFTGVSVVVLGLLAWGLGQKV
jgi:uncharacterized membrane protein